MLKKLTVFLSVIWSWGLAGAQVTDSIAFSSLTDTLILENVFVPPLTDSRTAGDMLRTVPGVFLRTSTAGGIQTVAAQGLQSQHVQVLWNDIPVSSGMLGVSDLSLFSVGYKQEVSYAIQNQELVTGGLAGVVNIKDKLGFQQGYFTGLRQSIGSFGQSLTSLYHQGAVKSHQWSVSGGYERAQNNFPFNDYTVFPNLVRTQKNGAYNRWHFYPKWQMNLKRGSVLSVFQEIVSSHREIPPFMVTPNNLALQNDFVARQMLKWSYKTSKMEHSVHGMFAYSNLYYEDFVLKRQQDNKEYLSFLRYQGSIKIHSNWKWSYGSDLKLTTVRTENYADGIREWGWDAHTAMQYQPAEYFSLKSMVKLTTRSGLGWYVPFLVESNAYLGKNRQWKLWVRTGMDTRYPTLNDRYWVPGGREDLLPEVNISTSTGTSVRFQIGKSLTWTHQAEAFFNRIKDMIFWMPTNRGYFQPMNVGKVLAYGATIQQSLDWVKGYHSISLRASYGWNRSGNMEKRFANDKSQWVQLPYFPVHSGKLSFDYTWKKLSFIIDGQSYSKRMVTRDGGNFVKPYSIFNTAVSYTQKIKMIELEGRMSFNNLLDEQYEEVRFRPMPGRNYLFTLFITWKHEKN